MFEASSPRRETTQHTDDPMDRAFAERGCCFSTPLVSSDQSSNAAPWWKRIGASSTHSKTNYEGPWWIRGWKKVRDWSEKVAGTKWKTFIRRFGRDQAYTRYGRFGTGFIDGQFRYDPLSYAMNFDEGQDDHHNDGEAPRPDFSSRYASIPTCKGSMDLGRD